MLDQTSPNVSIKPKGGYRGGGYPKGRARTLRSKVSGDIRHGVDGTTAEGKRYFDIIDTLIAEFGDSHLERLREIGQLRVVLERERLLCVNDPARSSEDMIRLTNTIERLEFRLRGRISARKKGKAPGTAGALGAFMGSRR